MNENSYLLKIELGNEKIHFKINQTNEKTLYYYYNSFTYDEIINLLKFHLKYMTIFQKFSNFLKQASLRIK